MKTATISLIRNDQEKIKGKVEKILEQYDNFVLVEVTDDQVKALQKEGLKVVIRNEIEKIMLGDITIDTSTPRYTQRGAVISHAAYAHNTDPGPDKHHYIVQFIGPIKEEWKKNIQDLDGILCDPLPSYSYIVEMDGETREKVSSLPFFRWIGHYDQAFRTSSRLLRDLAKKEDFENISGRAAALGTVKVKPKKVKPLSKGHETIQDKFSVSFQKEENLKDAFLKIKELGGEIVGEYGKVVTISIPTEKLTELANIHGVKLIDSVKVMKLHNNIARKIMSGSAPSSNLILPLTGKGEIIGIADTGLDTGDPNNVHEDFKGRIVGIKSWPISSEWDDKVNNRGDDDGPADEVSGHGTHVAGSVLGNGQKSGNYPGGAICGLANEAKLYFQAVEQLMDYKNTYLQQFKREHNNRIPSTYQLAGLPHDLKILFQQAYDNGVRIHSNSWGDDGEPGGYDYQSETVDKFVWDHKDMVILFSAGNDGIDNKGDGWIDPNSLNIPSTAKNCICVGASENVRDTGGYNPGGDCSLWGEGWPDEYPAEPFQSDRISDKDSDIAAFSSRGPCKDGRIKPDIVAPGTNILSVRSSLAKEDGWGRLPKNDKLYPFYMYNGGTSMSCPLTAGAVALIRQYLRQEGLNPSASLVKAALINVAVRKPYRFSATKKYHVSNFDPNICDWEQGYGHVNIKPFTTNSTVFKMKFIEGAGLTTGQLKDYSFEVINNNFPFKVTLVYTDYPGNGLINNLDLIVTSPDGKEYNDKQSTVNNVENAFIKSPKKGKYKVTIEAHNTSEGPQDYSLVISGGIM